MAKRLLVLMLLSAGVMAANETPEQVTAQFWRALSREPGHGASEPNLEQVFHQDAVIFGSRYKDAVPLLSQTLVVDFIKRQAEVGDTGFYECEVARQVKRYDRFATVYSVVESRTTKSAAKPDFVGVNSIQLYQFDDGWRIVSLYYQVEKDGLPVPLESGRSGVCLD